MRERGEEGGEREVRISLRDAISKVSCWTCSQREGGTTMNKPAILPKFAGRHIKENVGNLRGWRRGMRGIEGAPGIHG